MIDERLSDDRIARDDLAIQAPGEALGVTTFVEEPERDLLADAAAETPAQAAEPFSSLVPAIIGGALMMQTLNATVIANALPTMARSFHEDPVHLNTAITAYLLASAVFLPISGWMADRFGAKRIFLFAIVGYAAACMACGLAQNLPELHHGAHGRRGRRGDDGAGGPPRPAALHAQAQSGARHVRC